jgi:hypothetical protein
MIKVMKNLKKLKLIESKIEDLRLEMIHMSVDLNTKEKNYDDIAEFISTEAENAFCILLREFDYFISEIE